MSWIIRINLKDPNVEKIMVQNDDQISILIAEDSNFFTSTIEDMLDKEIGYAKISSVMKLGEILPTLQKIHIDVLFLDLHFPSGTSYELISDIKTQFPDLFLCAMSSQSDIRKAIGTLKDGTDYYMVKDDHIKSDIINAIRIAINKVNRTKQFRKTIDGVFDPKKYPMVVMKASDMGASIIYQDFEEFPEDVGNFQSFIGRINIGLLTVLSQGDHYHTGIYRLPAANSKFYSVYDYAFRLSDPDSVDVRMTTGYFHTLLFVPMSFQSIMPSAVELDSILEGITEILTDSKDLTPQNLNILKDVIFTRIKNHKLYG